MPLDATGFRRRTYDEILTAKIQKAKELFGEDIDTSELTPLGKYLRINAYDQSLTEEEAENIYYSISPTTASGQSLDRLCWLVGISRNPATPAEYSVQVTGEPDTVVPVGFLVGTESELTYYNTEEQTIGNEGTAEINVVCTEAGEIGNVSAADIVKIINPVANITNVQGLRATETGQEVESDYALRLRYEAARDGMGSCNATAIKAAIMRVPTVDSVAIAVNDTDEIDESGRPARSFECYISGGEGYETQIAEAIFEKKPIGIKTYGSITQTVVDDGGYSHDINFSHTSEIPVYVRITIYTSAEYASDTANQAIRDNIRELINGLVVGKDVIWSTLYTPIYAVNGVSEVTEIKLSNDEQTWLTKNIEVDTYQKAVFGGLYIDFNDSGIYEVIS